MLCMMVDKDFWQDAVPPQVHYGDMAESASAMFQVKVCHFDRVKYGLQRMSKTDTAIRNVNLNPV